ncbi:MAG: ABC transporter permease subunit [Pseudomonadota bacterium]
MAFGYAFLYLPIVVLVLWSFNGSRLVTVWGGFSLRWYRELLANEQLLAAAALSVRVAAVNATVATVLGTFAALALERFGAFRGRTPLLVMLTSPLVLPEVVTGLSLLLLFITLEQFIGWPDGRGFTTLTIAHVTFSMAYAAVVVRARLSGLDRDAEEAAMDLGATPAKAFLWVTVPRLGPALLAAWLLAFTLSLDDLVVASFVAGPGASTLPMAVFSQVRLGVSPQINALATLMILGVTLGLMASAWVMARARRRRTT